VRSHRTRRLVVTVTLGAVTAVLASSCSLQLEAVQLKITADNGSLTLVQPESHRFRGGEVVITITNETNSRRQFTLARTGAAPKALGARLLSAFSYLDDSRVVEVTGVMRPASITLEFGAIPTPSPTVTKLHVYMKPHVEYLLFDRLGGYKHGYALELDAQ
jgi:hypothetical protein